MVVIPVYSEYLFELVTNGPMRHATTERLGGASVRLGRMNQRHVVGPEYAWCFYQVACASPLAYLTNPSAFTNKTERFGVHDGTIMGWFPIRTWQIAHNFPPNILGELHPILF